MTTANILSQLGSAGVSTGFKNRIINGAMVIDQRNAGASVTQTTGNLYTVDRFYIGGSVTSKFTAQQNAGSVSTLATGGFNNYLGITSSSAYSVGSTDYFFLSQAIEGLNIADLQWGTANAKTVTLSFQVYSSLTGTFGGVVRNNGASRCYPFSYSIPVANTWTTTSVTIAGDTTGTWLTTNGVGIQVFWGMGVGSTYSGTAGSWSANNYLSATGATSVVGTNGATFYITGVQLEVGTTATNFDYRSYGTELALCQRYYEVQGYATGAITVWGTNYGIGAGNLVGYASLPFAVVKRTAPTVTISGTWTYTNSSGLTFVGTSASTYSFYVINGASAGTYSATTTSTSGITATAEL